MEVSMPRNSKLPLPGKVPCSLCGKILSYHYERSFLHSFVGIQNEMIFEEHDCTVWRKSPLALLFSFLAGAL